MKATVQTRVALSYQAGIAVNYHRGVADTYSGGIAKNLQGRLAQNYQGEDSIELPGRGGANFTAEDSAELSGGIAPLAQAWQAHAYRGDILLMMGGSAGLHEEETGKVESFDQR